MGEIRHLRFFEGLGVVIDVVYPGFAIKINNKFNAGHINTRFIEKRLARCNQWVVKIRQHLKFDPVRVRQTAAISGAQ